MWLQGAFWINDNGNNFISNWYQELLETKMKKKKVHFSLDYGRTSRVACGADCFFDFLVGLKVTNNRKKVTCKSCRVTRIFRRLK